MSVANLFFGKADSGNAKRQLPQGLSQRSKMMLYDKPLVWVTMSLMMLGIVMVY